ncbi:hypothetical protein GOB93_03215 [Acetobacter musti]|uniref:Methyltransferase n=1 Tax=Acetobacter musti TaxID=864732 RepID=A0ABX0JPU3_9PROT|nr:hypothetical protein [Acetobacter musti]NHN83649.1 hypothetical protein [Acetobacter musti]
MSRTAKVSSYERVKHEFYREPAFSVRALLAVERPFTNVVMDPCCGLGNIPDTLQREGIRAFGSDLINRGESPNRRMLGDFRRLIPFWRPETIITNPPYSCWEEIVALGMEAGAERVCLILPIRFLEGIVRSGWYQRYPIARLWAASQRIDMPPGGVIMKGKGGNKQYAWFVWEKGHIGPHYQGGWLPIMDKAA